MKQICFAEYILLVLFISRAKAGPLDLKNGDNEAKGSQPKDGPIMLKDPYQLSLEKSPECVADINRICGPGVVRNNFQAISCLQDGFKDTDISEPCQHLIWNYKRNLTIDQKYESAVKGVCSTMIKKLPECQNLPSGGGHLIPCLIEYVQNDSLSTHHCRSFLDRLKPIVFSDYRIIYRFSDACHADIESLQCGRIGNSHEELGEKVYHQQGKVLTCLASQLQNLKEECKHEILRVAELQADDYHNDRQLYFACRNDREKFCSEVQSGQGRVYKCLFKHKMDPFMSDDCRQKLVLRQRLEQENYRVNIGLARSCQDDIIENHCIRHLDRVASFGNARMSAVLLCLEAAMKDGKDVKPECKSELKEVRRSLMEDFQISPLLVVDCSKEIESHCGGNLIKNGGTIHCLMDLARPRKKEEVHKFVVEISSTCARSLESLLMQADIGENFEIDPILREACEPVVRFYCSNVSPGEGRIITCLMDSLDQPRMTDGCKESLMEVQYFINRDFRLDPQLYKSCKSEAINLCHASSKWYSSDGERGAFDVEQGYMVFACLYRHIDRTSSEPNVKPLSRKCALEVKRVMRERALSVNLDPEIESQCLSDLSKFCINKAQKFEEMNCLEDNLDDLNPECKKVVFEYIENVDKDPSINDIFLRSCEPFWQEYCKGGDAKLTMDLIDEDFQEELMQCLISYKNHPSMHKKCKAGVEHHQLITLKNYKFSHKFKEACDADISTHCANQNDKASVVNCLSELVLSDTLLERKKQRLTKQCRKQLDFELLQRSENILLDPELNRECESDVIKFCSNVEAGEAAVIQCLTENLKGLSPGCHKKIFKRMKFCMDDLDSPDSLFSCLQRYHKEDSFDVKCRGAILSRAHIIGKDFRLNRELSKVCYSDVMEFCQSELDNWKNDIEDDGRVVECLKRVYVKKHKNKKLTDSCENHIQNLIRMSAEDFKMNAVLTNLCNDEIIKHCKDASFLNDGSKTDRGEVEACLMNALKRGDITESKSRPCYQQIERLIEESIVDIQADHKLFKSCSVELKTYCLEVPRGEGRQLDCLLSQFLEKPSLLGENCRLVLSSRVDLWKKTKQDLPMSLQEVVQLVTSSPSANYFIAIFIIFVFIIFVGGLCFGRVTKRLRREIKNR